MRSDSYTILQLEAIEGLLEMYSDEHSVLQGAAGEDALNVGDVLNLVRQTRANSDDAARYRYARQHRMLDLRDEEKIDAALKESPATLDSSRGEKR